jgi:hypothetical protein
MAKMRMRFEEGLDEESLAVIGELRERFATWCRDHAPAVSEDTSDFELLLEWKINYSDGRLDMWSAAQIDEFVLSWCPGKVSAPPQWARTMVQTVSNGFLFLGDEGLLARGSDSAPQLAARTLMLADECVERMGDSSNFGMAKSLFAGMGVDFEQGPPENLQELMEQFNALPYEQRAQIMGGPEPEPLVIGPVLMPAAADVRASAATAPVLVGFHALSDYFQAPGRPLTATGNIKLADAAALSEILGTEPLTEEVGGQTFHRQSASRMPQLDHWQWWAREVGVLRKSKSRLVAVKAWRDRVAKDPVREARKAFRVLYDYGMISSYRLQALSPYDEVMDNGAIALLAIPLGTDGVTSFEHLVDVAAELRKRSGIRSPWGETREFIAFDVEFILTMAQRAGIIEQQDVVYEGTGLRRRQAGGTFSLTPFGVLMVVEVARQEGVTVETIDAPEDLSAQSLAGMLGDDDVDMPTAWGLIRRWLAAKSEPEAALSALLGELDAHTMCLLILDETPEGLTDVFAGVLRSIYEDGDDPFSAVALGWLVAREMVALETVDFELLDRSRLSLFGMIATVEPDSLADVWSADRSQAQLLAEIEVISRNLPFRALELLEVIGKDFPDKVVAKAARREALKARSRLANQQ